MGWFSRGSSNPVPKELERIRLKDIERDISAAQMKLEILSPELDAQIAYTNGLVKEAVNKKPERVNPIQTRLTAIRIEGSISQQERYMADAERIAGDIETLQGVEALKRQTIPPEHLASYQKIRMMDQEKFQKWMLGTSIENEEEDKFRRWIQTFVKVQRVANSLRVGSGVDEIVEAIEVARASGDADVVFSKIQERSPNVRT